MGWHFLLQGLFPTRDLTRASCFVGGFFTTEPAGKPHGKGRLCINSLGLKLLTPPDNLTYQFRQWYLPKRSLLWPPDAKRTDSLEKALMLGHIEGRRRRGWQKVRHEFEQALGAGDRQAGLACCSPWSYNESDITERLNWRDFDCFCFYCCLLLSKEGCNLGNSLGRLLCWWHWRQ